MIKMSFLVELVTGIEPATCSLRMSCSAIEPHQQIFSLYIIHFLKKLVKEQLMKNKEKISKLALN